MARIDIDYEVLGADNGMLMVNNIGNSSNHRLESIRMAAPRIDFSSHEERLDFIRERFHCKAPACGGCGSCRLPGGKPAVETFADYIDGKVEFVTISSGLWK